MIPDVNQSHSDRASQHATEPLITVEYEGDRLKIVGEATINIKHALALSKQSLDGYKNTIALIGRVGIYAPSNLASIVRSFERGLKLAKCKNLDLTAYLTMKSRLKTSDKNRLIMLLKTWQTAGFSGLDEGLRKILPYECGSSSAKSYRLFSETGGPYSEQEYDDLLSTYWYDFECGKSSLQNTTLNLLNASHSRRPIQYAHLKICDFENIGETNSVKGPRVSYPGAKDQGEIGFRMSKQETHPLSDDLWKLCSLQISDTISKFKEWTGYKPTPDEIQQLPFFLTPYKKWLLLKKDEVERYASSLELFSSELWHLSATSITKKLSSRNGSPVHSYRTNQNLNEFAYRMRYTKVKQLARLGASRNVLRYWLGQESLSAIESYYDDPAELARAVQESVGYIYAPIAQAFMGCLVNNETDAIRGTDPSSRIELDGNQILGNCGHEGFCSASVPIPCYRCTKFQPWVDGPHEQVLARLLKRQEQENNIFFKSTTRRLLTPLQLDKDIRAVERVIALCKQRLKDE
ncbi:hypothetical protein O999_23025 [Pseudomonas putida LF54]|uniref:hypothetical protein n=1 Tax=Pseudomonas putida TaxID=303 RepID=UPI0003AEB126|nr:hypothetical protein [Pseudomonas putida]ERL01311.1 hypothetical protein O999_23025 [Pseudomonas putida LF54]WAB96405.1 hypothetical protein OSW16_17850 [Pseudomonas putida]HEN8727041.1 hypothetical protein [Pseudomonas putida]